ncbi:hypothetical protein B0H14DRAFT_2891802, partial [Mycena olivaceomarginata]
WPTQNFRISEWILTADCDGPLGDCLGCNRDGYLGTTNQAGYDYTRINTAGWYNATFKVSTAVDLTTLFDNVDGNLCLHPKVPAGGDEFLKGLEASTKMGTVRDSLFQTSVRLRPGGPGKENYTLFYAKASVEAEGQFLIKTYNNEAKVAVMNIFQVNWIFCLPRKNGIRAEQVDILFRRRCRASLVPNIGWAHSITLGVGVAIGLGVRDEAIEVKALGCGFTIGKRVGISVAGTSAEINFGRFFPDQE